MHDLWIERYRPNTLDGYVFTDQQQRKQIEKWIAEKNIPHLLFSGAAGTGKTTLARILIKALDINPYDLLQINASNKNSVDDIRNTIINFVSTMPFGDLKIVLLDEADYLSHNAQGILRGLMETYQSQSRFILTCNFVHKIISPLKSRCCEMRIDKTDQTEFTARMATILMKENVQFELDILDSYVRATYPDLRKCLNLCQMNSVEGKLSAPHGDEGGATADYLLTAVDLFKRGKIREARTLLCQNVRSEDMEALFRWMYDNLSLWGDTPERQDQAIIIIRNSAANNSLVADHEINLSATIVELCNIE